jgi:hypothetical protein
MGSFFLCGNQYLRTGRASTAAVPGAPVPGRRAVVIARGWLSKNPRTGAWRFRVHPERNDHWKQNHATSRLAIRQVRELRKLREEIKRVDGLCLLGPWIKKALAEIDDHIQTADQARDLMMKPELPF